MNDIPYNLYINFNQLNNYLNLPTQNRDEKLLKCGFAAIELSTFLLKDVIKNSDKVNHTLLGIEKQFRLLIDLCSSTKAITFGSKTSKHLENLKLLSKAYTKNIDRITSLYFELAQKHSLGLENQCNQIRSLFGLEIKKYENLGLASNQFPDIVDILGLEDINYFNSEDMLFMITHQISECWFKLSIAELVEIDKHIDKQKLTDLNFNFNAVFTILMFLAEHIMVLENMILADYHPLRVALRGASGGQSHQAHQLFGIARKGYHQFLQRIKREGKDIVGILEEPDKEHEYLTIINNFTKLERALKNFFFQHYILSSNVIGSQSFGSIGYDLVSLVDKFVEPIFAEIDQAKYDLTLKTNFQYGQSAGVLILEKEQIINQDNIKLTSDEKVIKSVVDKYFEAISRFDKDYWVNLFDEEGFIEDPIGSRPYLGHDQLSIFFKGVIRFFAKLNMKIINSTIKNNIATVEWEAKAETYLGKQISFQGKEIFKINHTGKIISAQVDWDPSVISQQL